MKKKIRTFKTGATRNLDEDKFDYAGFLCPMVLERYALYMHGHRKQADGIIRDSDNWKKGITIKSYVSSLWRHFMDVWKSFTLKQEINEDAICAAIFNLSGMLHEHLKAKNNEKTN